MGRFQLGVDIGGTFTDLVLAEEATGQLLISKVLTTPEDPASAVMAGVDDLLERAGLAPAAITGIVHATTLATNALIEKKGARTGLITTKGFGDTLEIRRELRYDLYDLELAMPEPLVPRTLRCEIPERLDATGQVVTPLGEPEVAAAARALDAAGVQAIAICFLHSYANPAHERRSSDILRAAMPKVMLSVSSEICSDLREYERTTTTVLNAYLQPLIAHYLDDLCRLLAARGFAAIPFIMLSSGGVTTIVEAARQPIRLLESGPAAGALAAAYFGTAAGFRDLLAFDMGGTTAKICVVRDGRPQVNNQFEAARVHRFKKGSGYPVKVPAVDLIEIGAGGGSIAWVDAMGLLKVGPESAGASPGPACYGQGGSRPCITDADLVLGYLDPERFLGGRMRLHLPAAKAAIATIAQQLGLDEARTAWGIREVVNENMARAAQVYTAEQGVDISAFTLVAFGGAGPVHTYDVARKLGLRRILCPLGSGIASAVGLLVAPKRMDVVQAYVTNLDRADFARVNALFEEMEGRARRVLSEAGVAEDEMELLRSAEMRYRGQGYELAVPLPQGVLHGERQEELRQRFEATYRALYGRIIPGGSIEAINWRITGLQRRRAIPRPALVADAARQREPLRQRPVYWLDEYIDTRVYSRYELAPGDEIPGPALVEEDETTTAVGPGSIMQVDEAMNLIIQIGQEDAV